MSRYTFASLFAGGGLADTGLLQAGLSHAWSVEWDPDIAEWHQRNIGGQCIIADASEVDFRRLSGVDLLWASPCCTNASTANINGGETDEDRSAARAVARALTEIRPAWFALENVWPYRTFDSFEIIFECLHRLGYQVEVERVNAADHGVPQIRWRLILRATLFGSIRPLLKMSPWGGWYAAIEDLLSGKPDSNFAPWQIRRLKASGYPVGQFLVGQQCYRGALQIARQRSPAFAITAGSNQTSLRALLAPGDNPRGHSWRPRTDEEPSHCITASTGSRCAARAWITDTGGRSSRAACVRRGTEPVFTILSDSSHPVRSVLPGGRVVSLTPRALARLQSCPDLMQLPNGKGLACRIIGNGVPPPLAQHVALSLIGGPVHS